MDNIYERAFDISEGFNLDTEHDIPYLAGYSDDGKTIYIDRHLPRILSVKNRQGKVKATYILPYIIIHEIYEKAILLETDYDYEEAHRHATEHEKRFVESANIDWEDYTKQLQPYIKGAEKEALVRVPKDLDLEPYRDEKDFKELKKIMELQNGNE